MVYSNETTRLAMLLTADGVDVQDQGWELLRCLPDLDLHDVQCAMTSMLWAQLQLRAWTDLLHVDACHEFTCRFFALRRFCDRFGLPWQGARLQVDRWRETVTMTRRARIRLGAGTYDIGRGWGDEAWGAYAVVSVPMHHVLRSQPWHAAPLGGLVHGRFVLSGDAIRFLSAEHPAGRWSDLGMLGGSVTRATAIF
ncbi:MAG: hypothetical protein AAFV53_11145 [Myxococcota bacterium]